MGADVVGKEGVGDEAAREVEEGAALPGGGELAVFAAHADEVEA